MITLSDEKQQQLIGKDKGTLFGLGDSVRVNVAGVNMDLLQIDFDLTAKIKASEMNQTKKGSTKKAPAKKSNGRSKNSSKKN